MKCPFCNVEMVHGYLNCGAVIWADRKHKVSLLPDSTEQYALNLRSPLLSPNAIEGDCCPQCKRIIMDVSAYPNRLSPPVPPRNQI